MTLTYDRESVICQYLLTIYTNLTILATGLIFDFCEARYNSKSLFAYCLSRFAHRNQKKLVYNFLVFKIS